MLKIGLPLSGASVSEARIHFWGVTEFCCRCLEIGINAVPSVESQNSFSVRLKQVRSRDELGESESDLTLEEVRTKQRSATPPRVATPPPLNRELPTMSMPMRDMTNTTQQLQVDHLRSTGGCCFRTR